jgi:predicted MFS family arabinose efflux permease
LLPSGRLVDGNSRIASSAALAEIGGPASAGALIQLLTARIAILGDALSFLVSAVCLSRIRQPDARPTQRVAEDGRHWRYAALAGWRVTWQHPVLRALALSATLRTFGGGDFAALYGLYALRELNAAPVLYGALIGLGGVGALAGSLLTGRIVAWLGMRRALIVAAFWGGATSILTPLAFGPCALLILALAQLVGDSAHAIYAIAGTSVRQDAAPPEVLGRALATLRILQSAALPLGALVAGLASAALGLRLTLSLGAAAVFLAAFWLLRLPRTDQAVKSAKAE